MARAAADASVFNAIADPTRRAILDLLQESERAVADLLQAIRATPSALSQHLAVLRRAGLVSVTRRGRHRLYRIEPAPLREVADWIAVYDRFWSAKLDTLGAYLDRAHPPRTPPKAPE
jgi:DNA-binding transcriptional ArsR family regulator